MDVGRVEHELAELWRMSSTEERAVIRACRMNLVVACAPDGDLQATTQTIAELSESHPGRALVIAPEATDRGAPPLDAYVSSHCHRGAGGVQVCSEQVTLQPAAGSLHLIPGTVLQLLCEDLPVFTWWRRPLGARDPLLEPLLDLSDRFVVDCGKAPDPPAALAELSRIAADRSWDGHAGDLAWSRLEPYRELVASFFDGPAARSYLECITSVSISAGGPAGSVRATGAYLAGWIGSRLGWVADRKKAGWKRRDGKPVDAELHTVPGLAAGEVGGVRIEARDGTPPAAFVLERLSPYRRMLRLSVEVEKACPLPRLVRVTPLEQARALSVELARSGPDPVFEASLAEAARIATTRTGS